jgi:hypothetical protein
MSRHCSQSSAASPVEECQRFDGQVLVVREALTDQVVLERVHDHMPQVWRDAKAAISNIVATILWASNEYSPLPR